MNCILNLIKIFTKKINFNQSACHHIRDIPEQYPSERRGKIPKSLNPCAYGDIGRNQDNDHPFLNDDRLPLQCVSILAISAQYFAYGR